MFVNIIFVRFGLLRGHPVDNMFSLYFDYQYLSSFPFFPFFFFFFLGGGGWGVLIVPVPDHCIRDNPNNKK